MEKTEMDGVCSNMGKRRGVFIILVGRAEGKDTTWKTQA
jgi:hypothetical protein